MALELTMCIPAGTLSTDGEGSALLGSSWFSAGINVELGRSREPEGVDRTDVERLVMDGFATPWSGSRAKPTSSGS